jgi:DNA polymerase-3 subunit gamma/tau
MSGHTSLALYRKYRPQSFAHVLGQEAIVTALTGAIDLKRVAHAYIFAGSRGTGKTSTARIFARTLGVSENDMYEIDAASNRGIDDIREIRDGVNVHPFESPYKVYIVDEVHMLTKEAWNALLKTLEEPPAHALFILATTEIEKIPDTILSRCQVFAFKKPSREILKKVVTDIAKEEGYALEAGVAELIALLGDGSFRDTLGTLQKVIGSTASANKKISVSEAEKTTGAPRGRLVNDFVGGIVEGSAGSAEKSLAALSEAAAAGVSIKNFASLVVEKYRILLLMKSAPVAVKRLKDVISEEDWGEMEKLVKDSGAATVAGQNQKISSAVLVELLKAYDMTGRTHIDTLPLEMVVVRLAGEGIAR